MARTLIGRDAHHDRPLSQFAVQAFAAGQAAGYIGGMVMPTVPVDKESDRYYVIDKASFLQLPETLRSRKTPANRVEWRVSSDAYHCDNHALADEIAIEDMANADSVLRLRQGSVDFVVEGLLRARERRVALKVTSISNVGSGAILASQASADEAQWSNVNSANIFAQVSTGTAFIRSTTGFIPNTMAMDYNSYQLMRRNALLLDMFKYTSGGQLTDDQIKSLFGIQNLWISRGVFNSAKEGKAASMSDIWGDNVLIAYINPNVKSQRVATLGLSMNWRPEGMPTDMQVLRSLENTAGSKHVEVIETGYFRDEKIVGSELGYVLSNTIK